MSFFDYLAKNPIYVVIVAVFIFVILLATVLKFFIMKKLNGKTKPAQDIKDENCAENLSEKSENNENN